MAWVIVAGVLGVIIICGGLFLRRLLRQLAELRRQITWFDRQMRAQRARVTFLRTLIADEEDDGDGEPPPQAAVVNGNSPSDPPDPPDAATPVRRKGHLGLYLGGAVAAAVAVGTAAREAFSKHGAQLTATVSTAAVAAATITLVCVHPWNSDSGQPPSTEPTAATASATPPRRSHQPPASGSTAPGASGSPAAPSASVFPSPEASAASDVGTVSSTEDTSISAMLPARPPRRRGHSHGATPPGRTRRPAPPGRTRRPRPTASPRPSYPSEGAPAAGLCLHVSVPPLPDVYVCLAGH